MTEVVEIPVARDGKLESWRLTWEDYPDCAITVASPQGDTYTVVASDLFRCLQEVRSQLDPHGIRICCKGALENAYPTPMGVEYGARMVAVTPAWRGVTAFDNYSIFDPVPPSDVATVEAQEKFRHQTLDRQRIHHFVRAINVYGWLLLLVGNIMQRRIMLRRLGWWEEVKEERKASRRQRRTR